MKNETRRALRRTRLAAAALCLLLGGGTLAAAAAVASPGSGAGTPDGDRQSTVVILVRHAEKRTDDPKDPALSKAGVERAEALAKMLSEAGVTHLFSSEFRRTRETLAPLASRLGMQVREVSARTPEDQVAAIRGLPAGSVAVVAGHSNTVPELVRLLGGEVSELIDAGHGPMIGDASYDRMFLVILSAAGGTAPADRAKTVELRYGE